MASNYQEHQRQQQKQQQREREERERIESERLQQQQQQEQQEGDQGQRRRGTDDTREWVHPNMPYYVSVTLYPLAGPVDLAHLEQMAVYYFIYGWVFLLVGLVAVVAPLTFSLIIEQFLGWLILLGGFLTILNYFFVFGAPGSLSLFLLGALHLVAGFWLLTSPFQGLISITIVIAAWMLAQGVAKLLMGFTVRSISSWPVVVLSGVLSIVLSITILALFPSSALWVLGAIVGADLAFTGLSIITLSVLAACGKRIHEEHASDRLLSATAPA